jgi:hypothetical protein
MGRWSAQVPAGLSARAEGLMSWQQVVLFGIVLEPEIFRLALSRFTCRNLLLGVVLRI